MTDAFDELVRILDWCIAGTQRNVETEILDLLKDQGIRIRQDDGKLREITLSKPTSVDNAYVIGLRYIKNDGTQTEDLFSVEKGHPITSHYKGSLKKRWPEYKGTYKQMATFALVGSVQDSITSVNTFSLLTRT